MRIAGFAAVLGCLMCVPGPAYGADADRGKALYEARCDSCHGSGIHVREARKATSFDGIRAQVARWTGELGGGWSVEEIDDVTVYLNSRYYFFACPESVCRRGQAGISPGSVTTVGTVLNVP
jgi:hypothetical protein